MNREEFQSFYFIDEGIEAQRKKWNSGSKMGPDGHCLGCGGEGQSWEEDGVGGTGDPGPALAMPLYATVYTRLPGVGVGGRRH